METDAEVPWRQLNPSLHAILVTEQGDAVTGCVVLLPAWHAEFLWIAPAYRGRVSVARRLRDRVLAEVRRRQAPTLLMSAVSKEMNGILIGMGAERLPGDHYVLNLSQEATWHQP